MKVRLVAVTLILALLATMVVAPQRAAAASQSAPTTNALTVPLGTITGPLGTLTNAALNITQFQVVNGAVLAILRIRTWSTPRDTQETPADPIQSR